MLKVKTLALPVTAVVLCAIGLGLALYQGPINQQEEVWVSKGFDLTGPPNPTVQEIAEMQNALEDGTPLPPGWAVIESHGNFTAKLSGYIAASGEHQLIVTLFDESNDLESAYLSVDGTVVFQASRSNGSIVVMGGSAIATLSAWILPAAGQTVRLEWEGFDGSSQHAQVTL